MEMYRKRRAAAEPNREMKDNEEEEDEYFLNASIDVPPPSKRSKVLPMDEKIASEIRLLRTAILDAVILEGSKTTE